MKIVEDIYLDDNSIKWRVGDRCCVKTNECVIKGEIISINPDCNLIMIKKHKGYVEFFNISQIISIVKIEDEFDSDN